MPRSDDYEQSFEIARRELIEKEPLELAHFAGMETQDQQTGKIMFSLNFLNQRLRVSWPELVISIAGSDQPVGLQEKVFLAHYLQGAWNSKGTLPSGQWIAFQDLPDGRFYIDPFIRRAKMPLANGYGSKPDLLPSLAAQIYGAIPFDQGDYSVMIKVLPLVPIALILWKGDDEFPPESNILFDQTIGKIFTAEDIAWLAGRIVYPLISRVPRA